MSQSAPLSGSKPPRPIGRRGAARLRLAIPVRLITTHSNLTCVLLDLSLTGARLGLSAPLQPGDCAYLQIDQIEVFAEVVRRSSGVGGGVNGVVFDEPLSQAEVLAVRHHAETFEQREREALRDQVRRWVSGDARA